MTLVEFLDLINLKDEYAGTLSGGQKKLLELANANSSSEDGIATSSGCRTIQLVRR